MFNLGKNKIIKKWNNKPISELENHIRQNFPPLTWERIYVRIYDKIRTTQTLSPDVITQVSDFLKKYYGQRLK